MPQGFQAPRVNDFTIEVGTVNGSGSQTANNVLMRSIFQMGVPVTGKNMFPSNIAGLPTWFQIRVSAKGYQARKAGVDLLICMNPESVSEDLQKLNPGGIAILDEALPVNDTLSDRQIFKVPFQSLVVSVCPDAKLHKLVKNMIYVGVAAQLLGLEMEEIRNAIAKQLSGKAKAITLNQEAAQVGFDWATTNLPVQTHFKVVRSNQTSGQLIIDGNTACALGALFAGVSVVAWYPITPSSSLVESLIEYGERFKVDSEGKSSLAVIQMEDELASAGVVFGAGWAGARSMTATSGPGVDLMSEFIGLAYFAEIPGVFIDVQRTGPSTGLPTRTAQGDITLCATCSHGDTRHICLYPASMEECFTFTYAAFDLAERYQCPVFVVTDLDLGMQNYASTPFPYPQTPLDRGKVLDQAALADLPNWGRYRDVDGDGIPWRTLPGTPGGRGAYFTRGSGHNAMAQYSEKPAEYVALVNRLRMKYEKSKERVPAPLLEDADAQVGILAFGSSHPAVVEARDLLWETQSLKTRYLRLRALPFSDAVRSFLLANETTFVVEQNRDGQMAGLLRDAYPEAAARIVSVLHYDNLPITAQSITDQILAHGKRG